jgi:anti-sigma factor RsiW
MTAKKPIATEELHAWLDGELSDERWADVETYLREHPDEQQRLDAYRADGAAIARLFSVDPAGSLPPASRRAVPRRAAAGARWWRQAVAALVLLGIGTGAGWIGRAYRDTTATARLANNAAAAYLILASPGAQPVASASLNDLSRTLSDALGVTTKLRDPSGSGYSITAVRLVPQAKRRAAQIVMRGPAGEMVAFYIEARPGATETPMWRVAADGLTTLVWEDDDLACAIIGTLPPDELERVGRKIYEALLG